MQRPRLQPLLFLSCLAGFACGPLVDDGGVDASNSAGQDVESPAAFLERDEDIFAEIHDRCECPGPHPDGYENRLDNLRDGIETMGLQIDAECAAWHLERLGAPGCDLPLEPNPCAVFFGIKEEGSPCTRGVWLDDCLPELHCSSSSRNSPEAGICQLRPELGEPCLDHQADSCAEGLCTDGLCTLDSSFVGDPCWLDCGSGLRCIDQVCQEPTRCTALVR